MGLGGFGGGWGEGQRLFGEMSASSTGPNGFGEGSGEGLLFPLWD